MFMKEVNQELISFLEKEIFPLYGQNDIGHNIDHIKYVIDRSLKFALNVPDINLDMVYTIAAMHDVGVYIDRDNHEKVSAEILLKTEGLRTFFSEDEIRIMAEAVEDHRASLEYEPRSIYGKIVSSADRNVSIDLPLIRTFTFRMKAKPGTSMDKILEESRQHLIKKFGNKGYAKEKMYFEDEEYKTFLRDISLLVNDKEAFKKKYIEINHLEGVFGNMEINERLKNIFYLIRENNPEMSLDQLLIATYKEGNYEESFEVMKEKILDACNIDEFEYYLSDVNPSLREYVIESIFPQYENNDKAHGIIHIREVIRRAFALNETLKLNLDKNMIYAIAACHDLGKFINHEIHEKIAADIFINDENMKKFFSDEERMIIKEAIEDHRSSKGDLPRSDYGKLISSADRNTRIEIVFIRSFFVAKERQPETNIEDYLDYTFKRLSKRYGEENPENMFYEDEIYHEFLNDMRELLKDEIAFKDLYCKVNHLDDRSKTVDFYEGEVHYIKSYKRGENNG